MATTQFKRDDLEALKINMVRSLILPRVQDEEGQNHGPHTDKLLSFEDNSVENLYDFDSDSKIFKFDFAQWSVATRCETKVNRGAQDFEAKWLKEEFVELGINYAGKIQITHRDAPNRPLFIRVNGVRSYDPAGSTETKQSNGVVIDDNYWSMMIQVLVAQIMAAKVGAPKDFITQVYNITQNLINVYHKRDMMHTWMTDQVIKACYERVQPLTYSDFMQNKLQYSGGHILLDLMSGGHAHTKEYLERCARFSKSELNEVEVKPCTTYFRHIVEREARKQLEEDHTNKEYNSLLKHSKAMKLGSAITLKQLTKTIPSLLITNEAGSNMRKLRNDIQRVKDDYATQLEEAKRRYRSTLRE